MKNKFHFDRTCSFVDLFRFPFITSIVFWKCNRFVIEYSESSTSIHSCRFLMIGQIICVILVRCAFDLDSTADCSDICVIFFYTGLDKHFNFFEFRYLTYELPRNSRDSSLTLKLLLWNRITLAFQMVSE